MFFCCVVVIGTHANADKNTCFCGYAAYEAKKDVILKAWKYNPRPLTADDVEIKITHCGICGSDIHTVTGGWGPGTLFPCIPGHEIIGTIAAIGSAVKDFKIGDRVGVGPQCWSCLEKDCQYCSAGEEQFCPKGIFTYNAKFADGQIAQGGYADRVRAHSHFTFKIPDKLSSEIAAPLLCAGVTVYRPLSRAKFTKNSKVGIIGIGGLGHIAVQMAVKMGAQVTAISSSNSKREDALKLGAHHYISSSDDAAVAAARRSFDFVLMTANVGASAELSKYISMIAVGGTLCAVAVPEEEFKIIPFHLILSEVKFTASAIGSHKEMKQMLQFCADHDVKPWIQVFPLTQVNDALKQVDTNKIRFRAVLDCSK